MANPTPSPAIGEDFPDQPDETADEHPSDKPDLAAFAAKLGLRTSKGSAEAGDEGDDSGERPWSETVATSASAAVDRVTTSLASGLGAVADRLQRLSQRLADRTSSD
ncbi:MAG: hypothetical protein HKN44_07845 [Ilumatobacter sp.]|nr:hypothetical protein [Ilumatobacter sp.]